MHMASLCGGWTNADVDTFHADGRGMTAQQQSRAGHWLISFSSSMISMVCLTLLDFLGSTMLNSKGKKAKLVGLRHQPPECFFQQLHRKRNLTHGLHKSHDLQREPLP